MYRNKKYLGIKVNEFGDTLMIDLCNTDRCDCCNLPCQKNPMMAPLQEPYEHHQCDGFVDIHKISDDYFSFDCRNCNLRVMVPTSIKNVQELKDYFTKSQ